MSQRLTNMRADFRHFDPDTQQVGMHFEAAEDGFATLIVFNPQGGWILSLGEIAVRAGANTLAWQGHDADGWPLADGQYSLELFGFGVDRRPSGAAPLRLQIALARQHPVPEPHAGATFRGLPWFADVLAGSRT